MFKSFTSSENKPTASGGRPAPTDLTPPDSVRRAVRLMLYGAPASLIFGTYGIIYGLVNKADIIKAAHYTNSQFTFALIVGFVFSLLYAALWVWIARTNQAGRSWARIVATVLFFFWTYQTYRGIGGLKSWLDIVTLVIMLAIWGIGVGALYYLWRPESAAFFKPAGQQ
jgi:hypothetical protein